MYCKFDEQNRLVDFNEAFTEKGMYYIGNMPKDFFDQSKEELAKYKIVNNQIIYHPEEDEEIESELNLLPQKLLDME